MSEQNVALHRRLLGPFNSRDVDAFLELCDPQIEFHATFSAVGGAVYHGHDGIRQYFRDIEEVWRGDFLVEPEAYFDFGERTLAFSVLHGHGPQSGAEVTLPAAQLCRWRDGRIVLMKAYAHKEDALTDLGVSEEALEQSRSDDPSFLRGGRTGEAVEATVLDRLLDAMNRHDLDAMVACFHEEYRSEQPLHPDRHFAGREQVRKNWGLMFDEVPDLRADLLRSATSGDEVWTEWRMHGVKRDGSAFEYRGVGIWGIDADRIARARLYFEPVQAEGGGIDESIQRLVGRKP